MGHVGSGENFKRYRVWNREIKPSHGAWRIFQISRLFQELDAWAFIWAMGWSPRGSCEYWWHRKTCLSLAGGEHLVCRGIFQQDNHPKHQHQHTNVFASLWIWACSNHLNWTIAQVCKTNNIKKYFAWRTGPRSPTRLQFHWTLQGETLWCLHNCVMYFLWGGTVV